MSFFNNLSIGLSSLLSPADVSNKVNEILNMWVGPLFTLVGAIGCVYIIILAVQYAKAEGDSKRAEVKTRLSNCVIGVLSLLIFGGLCIGLDWAAVADIFGYAKS